MEYEDSKNALFVEPNAYIQNFSKERSGVKKVIFSEPYETMPNYYINNDFGKDKCACHDSKDHKNFSPQENRKPNNCQSFQNNPMFDFKKLMPMLTSFFGKGFDISGVSKILNSSSLSEQNSSNNILTNIMNILSTDMGKNILGLLGKKSIKNTKKNSKKIENIKSNDFCVEDYQRVN